MAITKYSQRQRLHPTPRQIELLKAIWETEGSKTAAEKFSIKAQTLQGHMLRFRKKIGVKSTGRYGVIALLKWGVRAGILTMLLLTVQARPHRRPPPPVPPPVTSYVTNYTSVVLGWNPVLANVYQVQYSDGSQTYLSGLTFSTTIMLSQLRTNSVYSFSVRDSSNGVWSDFSNVVQFGTTSNVVVSGSTTLQ